MNTYLYIVAAICVATGIFVAWKRRQSPVADESPDERHNRLYKEAYELIKPYLILNGARAKKATSSRGRRDLSRGIENLKIVAHMNPLNWAAFWLMGKAYQAREMSDEACDAFGKAYLLQREHADVAREYMFECLKTGKTGQAVKLAYEALRLRPDEAGLKANLALCLFIDAQLDKAMDFVEDALKADPSDEITKTVKRSIDEVRAGKRPQPRRYGDL